MPIVYSPILWNKKRVLNDVEKIIHLISVMVFQPFCQLTARRTLHPSALHGGSVLFAENLTFSLEDEMGFNRLSMRSSFCLKDRLTWTFKTQTILRTNEGFTGPLPSKYKCIPVGV